MVGFLHYSRKMAQRNLPGTNDVRSADPAHSQIDVFVSLNEQELLSCRTRRFSGKFYFNFNCVLHMQK